MVTSWLGCKKTGRDLSAGGRGVMRWSKERANSNLSARRACNESDNYMIYYTGENSLQIIADNRPHENHSPLWFPRHAKERKGGGAVCKSYHVLLFVKYVVYGWQRFQAICCYLAASKSRGRFLFGDAWIHRNGQWNWEVKGKMKVHFFGLHGLIFIERVLKNRSKIHFSTLER